MEARTAEEWGRVAVSLPWWRWMPGMRAIDSDGQAVRVVQASGAGVLEDVGGAAYPMPSTPPDPDDPATAGCLLALLGDAVWRVEKGYDHTNWRHYVENAGPREDDWGQPTTLGRACIAAAEALGCWPGGGA